MGELCRLKRVVLKLSGEALKQENSASSLDTNALNQVCERIGKLQAQNIETAVVLGGGNFLRGVSATQESLARYTADMMGMMGTAMNALALRDALSSAQVPATIQAPFQLPGISDVFDLHKADQILTGGTLLLLAGGTGHPYFTTDTTAALRACEIQADAILKATKVDGVYSDDPHRVQTARRYRLLSYEDALKNNISVMDGTAFSLCRQNNLPIIVYNFADSEAITSILRGDLTRATLVSYRETQPD